MYEVKFDWATAEVKEDAEHLVLTVSLDSEPDQWWRHAFQSLAEGVRAEVDSSSSGGSVTVRGLEKDDVESIRESLDSMAVKANEQAERDRKEVEATERGDHDQTARLDEAARSMTERFRKPKSE